MIHNVTVALSATCNTREGVNICSVSLISPCAYKTNVQATAVSPFIRKTTPRKSAEWASSVATFISSPVPAASIMSLYLPGNRQHWSFRRTDIQLRTKKKANYRKCSNMKFISLKKKNYKRNSLLFCQEQPQKEKKGQRWSGNRSQMNSPFLLKYLITDFNEVPIKTIIPLQLRVLPSVKHTKTASVVEKFSSKMKEDGAPIPHAGSTCMCVSDNDLPFHTHAQGPPLSPPPSGSPGRHTHTCTPAHACAQQDWPLGCWALWLPRSFGCFSPRCLSPPTACVCVWVCCRLSVSICTLFSSQNTADS